MHIPVSHRHPLPMEQLDIASKITFLAMEYHMDQQRPLNTARLARALRRLFRKVKAKPQPRDAAESSFQIIRKQSQNYMRPISLLSSLPDFDAFQFTSLANLSLDTAPALARSASINLRERPSSLLPYRSLSQLNLRSGYLGREIASTQLPLSSSPRESKFTEIFRDSLVSSRSLLLREVLEEHSPAEPVSSSANSITKAKYLRSRRQSTARVSESACEPSSSAHHTQGQALSVTRADTTRRATSNRASLYPIREFDESARTSPSTPGYDMASCDRSGRERELEVAAGLCAPPSISTDSSSPSRKLHRSQASDQLRGLPPQELFSSSQSPPNRKPKQSSLSSSKSSSAGGERDEFYHLVKHFASYCLLDVTIPGCPVSSVSRDLEYVYNIKDRFVLNAHEITELAMDLSVGIDPQGREVTYLMLYSPLISPDTSETSLIMVSAIDVTGYVEYAAMQENKPGARGSFKERANSNSSADQAAKNPNLPKTTRFHETDAHYAPARASYEEDVWMMIANESIGVLDKEPVDEPEIIYGPSSSKDQGELSASQNNVDYGDNDVLERFVGSLQSLYSDYFLLTFNPENITFYEISFLSPSVYSTGEWITGHLSVNSADSMKIFMAHLARGNRFKATLKWGDRGQDKQVFCTPLIGAQTNTWICMLVDPATLVPW